MATELALRALNENLRDQEPFPVHVHDLAHSDSHHSLRERGVCTFVTGTGITIADLSEEIRNIISDFFARNPDTVSLVVNSPINRHHHSPTLRGHYEVLAFRKGGLQASKDSILCRRSTVAASLEALLRSSLPGWEVSGT